MQSYDNYLDRNHDEAYESRYGSDICEDCECETCECFEPDFEPDFEIDEDVCFGGVDW